LLTELTIDKQDEKWTIQDIIETHINSATNIGIIQNDKLHLYGLFGNNYPIIKIEKQQMYHCQVVGTLTVDPVFEERSYNLLDFFLAMQ